MSTQRRIALQLQRAQPAVQSLRKTIIDNANFLIKEMKEHDFTEVSEIVRACTALGIRRAYLRGLQHPINEEGDINKYIYRFNMLGALPFQNQADGQFTDKAFSWHVDQEGIQGDPAKSFMVQAQTIDATPFVDIDTNCSLNTISH